MKRHQVLWVGLVTAVAVGGCAVMVNFMPLRHEGHVAYDSALVFKELLSDGP